MRQITVKELRGFGEFITWLGEERAGVWWNSHARRYLYFSSRSPYFHNCTYARKTKALFEKLEQESFLEWLEDHLDEVELWENSRER